MIVSFTIPGTLPNLNDMINADRYNRFAGAKLKKDTQKRIKACLTDVGHVPSPLVVHFHWIEPNRRRDPDNIAAAKKYILDALQEAGIIDGDGWSHVIGFEDTFYVDKNNPRVEVELWHQ